MVIWIIGLSGSGKTTLSKLVYERLKPMMPTLVRLDGDIIRELFGNDVDYSIEGRRKNAERLSRLSKFFADQNISIIAAVLSIFPEWQKWNRNNIAEYAQVYLKASVDTLARRDEKNLYIPAFQGRLKNVVGVDIAFPEPVNSDITIDNTGERDNLGELAEQVISLPAAQEAILRCKRK
ncbi:MAG: adenylyl-sulfate kinase [Omnitrophica bacterium]|nr:adenylyl-sulfate kinase [Candidatus Omnitrophota bacterium]